MKHSLDNTHQEKLTEKEEPMGIDWDKIDKLLKENKENK